MKTRNGFVSNSSSTSFCIYGVKIDDSLLDIMKGFKTRSPDAYKKVIETFSEKEWFKDCEKMRELLERIDNLNDSESDEVNEYLENEHYSIEVLEFIIPTKMSVYNPGDGYYIGRSWSKIGDDETGAEFKSKIEEQLKSVFGNDVKFDTHEEAWRDG